MADVFYEPQTTIVFKERGNPNTLRTHPKTLSSNSLINGRGYLHWLRPPACDWSGRYYKRLLTFSDPVEQMVKRVSYSFWRDQPEFESAFRPAFFLSFQISYRIGKAFILNKN